jgi:TonB family protein
MPSILVVEQERRYIERINDALGAEGWKTRVVGSQAEALRAGASEAPDLVLVSADIPGVEAVASSFSRSAGGPGVIALLAENAAQAGVGGIEADELLAKPFTEQELRLVVRRALAARRAAAAPPPQPTTDEPKLTSRDIFGDMLAEVEKEVAAPAAPPAPTAAQAAATRREEEINRKLEQTLSGVFGLGASAKAKPAASSAPAKRSDGKGDDLDALISKTLSGLGATGKAAAATTPGIAAPRPAPPPPTASPAATTVPAPAASGAAGAEARKPPKTAADLGFSELEELARPRRRPDPAAAPAPAKPQAPAGPAPTASSAPPPAPRSAPPRTAPQAPVRTVAPPPPPQRVDAPMATQQIPVAAGGQQPGERFGQYTLQEKVAAGGMAEVWKARMRGVEGFQKTVAIKKILPHLTDNSEFIGMFIDEAKLAAQLSHPNIIHIYDLGKIGRDYYIAMEYVEGKDLRSIMNAARKKSLPLPLGLALLVASRLASALDYAHRKRDFEGRELGLVHRDVSPQNVLITFEGDIKLCDFGIAKAVTKASQTQMGALKGKLQYMSPEQAWGKPVDSRSDIFSLGAILFEMLTGERLFPGGSEISVLEAVRDGRTRTAREISPAVPPEVDEIVHRALAREPDQRFASAGEMQSRLESVLYGLKPAPGPTDLAAYLHRLFQADDPLVATTATTAAAVAAAPAAQPAAEPAAPPPPPPPEPAPDEYALSPAAPTAPLAPIPPLGGVLGEEGERRGRSLLVAAIAAALAVLALLTYFLVARSKRGAAAPPPPAPAASAAPTAPPPAPAAVPALAAAPAGHAKVDVNGLVDQELAKREGDLRKKFEDQQKRLEKELAATKAASAKPVAAVPASATATPPAPVPAVSAPAVAPPQASEPPAPRESKETRAEAPPLPIPSTAPAAPPAAEPRPSHAPPAVRAGELVEEGPDVVWPQLVSFSKPEYPALARRLRVEGVVIVSVLVDDSGHVESAKLSQSVKQNVGINEAALGAARTAVFKPATQGGVKVKMWTKLKIPFKP